LDIFGIGLPELLVIGIIAIVVLGPDRLPEAARTLGKAVADFRRAIEPARSAWAEVSREITTVTQVPVEGTGNPWTVHPVAEGLTEDERDKFFKTGELPTWKIDEMAKMEVVHRNGANGASALDAPDSDLLEYPMPHDESSFNKLSSVGEALEELDYPEPGTS